MLQERAKMHGFDLQLLPVAHPGVEQKATWLQIRRDRPDHVPLWAGVMNSTAIGGPGHRLSAREDARHLVGGRRADVGRRRVPRATARLTLQHGAEPNSKVVGDMLAMVA